LQVLAESDPGKIDIENINENDEHVEMNIGVFQGECVKYLTSIREAFPGISFLS
jgi:hypothetical protein